MMKYPKIKRIYEVDIRKFLHQPVYYQVKRDGTNIGVYLNDNNELTLRSRELDVARDDLFLIFEQCQYSGHIKYLLEEFPDATVFIELMSKGKSPARFELHNYHHFEVIDIHDGNKWLNVLNVVKYCGKYVLPCVKTIDYTYHPSEESLLEFSQKMLSNIPEFEGVVLKNLNNNMVKFKNELPQKLSKKDIEKITLPILKDEEVYSTIHKVLSDLEYMDRFITKIAMPKIGEAIGKECKETKTRPPKQLYQYYLEVLKEMEC